MNPRARIHVRHFPDEPTLWEWVLVLDGEVAASSTQSWSTRTEALMYASIVSLALKLTMTEECRT